MFSLLFSNKPSKKYPFGCSHHYSHQNLIDYDFKEKESQFFSEPAFPIPLAQKACLNSQISSESLNAPRKPLLQVSPQNSKRLSPPLHSSHGPLPSDFFALIPPSLVNLSPDSSFPPNKIKLRKKESIPYHTVPNFNEPLHVIKAKNYNAQQVAAHKSKKDFSSFTHKLFKLGFFKKSSKQKTSENNIHDENDLTDFESALLQLDVVPISSTYTSNYEDLSSGYNFIPPKSLDTLDTLDASLKLDKTNNSSNRSSTTLVEGISINNNPEMTIESIKSIYYKSLSKLSTINKPLAQRVAINTIIKSAQSILSQSSSDIPDPSEIDLLLAQKFYNSSNNSSRRSFKSKKLKSNPQTLLDLAEFY
ncbi:hypothetical protein AYI68_g221 [Smittium mucronatum]|uniref:Uncharacterized protein n=1 Tax=Smittium mucronatum TaxID=133383 RepID=A0A1R0H8Z9_9FUNG|nr:hypothetical protein AYI68_g221 [Smittium mucronatum]